MNGELDRLLKEHLWQRYIALFEENTRLISFITHKGFTMSDVTQTPGLVPEDQISAQMAEAVIYPATQEAQSEVGEVRRRFVQTPDMINGDPVEQEPPRAM